MMFGLPFAIGVFCYFFAQMFGLFAVCTVAIRIVYPHPGLPRLREAAFAGSVAALLALLAGTLLQVMP